MLSHNDRGVVALIIIKNETDKKNSVRAIPFWFFADPPVHILIFLRTPHIFLIFFPFRPPLLRISNPKVLVCILSYLVEIYYHRNLNIAPGLTYDHLMTGHNNSNPASKWSATMKPFLFSWFLTGHQTLFWIKMVYSVINRGFLWVCACG